MTDRLDELLVQALATGEVPGDATHSERQELENLLDVKRAIASYATSVHTEATESKPVARARFERFVLENGAAKPGMRRRAGRGAGFLSWFKGSGRMRAVVAATTVVVLIAVGAFATPALFNDVETASAQVLVPGEYVQFEAVAGESSGQTVNVSADFGDVAVVLDEETEVVDSAGERPAEVRSGRVVVVGGIVGDDLTVRARTVAVSASEGQQPDYRPPRQFEEYRDIGGRIVAFAVGDDGEPRIAILTNEGLFVVRVDTASLEALLQSVSTAVGANVDVVRSDAENPLVFGVKHSGSERPDGPGLGADRPEPDWPSVTGVVTAIEAATLTIETSGGVRDVLLTRRTQFRIVDDTFDRAQPIADQVIGRVANVVVFPVRDRPADLVADTVIIGRQAGE